MDADGTWRFLWSSANTKGIDKLVTARYTVTAFDLVNPRQTASTSFFLKKPEFYINPQPGAVQQGDYIQLSGVAEKGVTNVKIDIADSTGKILLRFRPGKCGWFFQLSVPGGYAAGTLFCERRQPVYERYSQKYYDRCRSWRGIPDRYAFPRGNYYGKCHRASHNFGFYDTKCRSQTISRPYIKRSCYCRSCFFRYDRSRIVFLGSR